MSKLVEKFFFLAIAYNYVVGMCGVYVCIHSAAMHFMIPMGTSGLVTGLEPDTEYICSVSGVWTEMVTEMVGNPRIREMAMVTVRANTLSRGTCMCVRTQAM